MREAGGLRFDADGAELVSGAVSGPLIDALLPAFEAGGRHRPGTRSLDVPDAIADAVRPEGPIGALAQAWRPGRNGPMRPVRILLFDKTPETNWAVPWHQDRAIAVRARHDLPGFRNWNAKDGVTHVEPPPELLAAMVTLRLHLDDAGEDNGALDILPGSHRLGRLPAAEVVRLGREGEAVRCTARRGDVLAMRLMTVHKSERATRPARRRVLHADFSADELPPPLEWWTGVR